MATVVMVVVGIAAPIILMVSPQFSPDVVGAGWFAALPSVLMGASFILGIMFRQTRISALSLIWLGLTARGSQHFGGALPDAAAGDFVFVASLLLPVLSICLFLMAERRAFSARGIVRFYLALASLGVLYWLPGLERFHEFVISLPPWLVGAYAPEAFNLAPVSGVLLLAAAGAMLSLERPESPALGYMFTALLVVGVVTLNAPMSAWPGGDSTLTVYRCMCLAVGGLLLWCVLDGAWRHAYVDELTQMPGRRPMNHHFASLGRDYALAVVDLDRFKRVNDKYGHDVGDQVLRFVAGSIRSVKRATAYRFGGEEFVVVFAGRAAEDSYEIMESLRKQIAKRPFLLRDASRPKRRPKPRQVRSKRKEVQLKLTVSIGVASSTDSEQEPDVILGLADKALYRAKRSGRNRVCVTEQK
jgi:GGDEF domain-containing protein